MNSGHWDTSLVGDFNVDEHFGFVYLVTNTATGRAYIGKKSMWSTVTKKINRADGNGKKNTKVTTESDWRVYSTSSRQINTEISNGATFKFQILRLHNNKGSLAYAEVQEMVMRDVLRVKMPDGTRAYYNGCIPGIKFIPPDECALDTRVKIAVSMKGNNNSAKPRKSPTTATKRKLSAAMKGNTNAVGNKGNTTKRKSK